MTDIILYRSEGLIMKLLKKQNCLFIFILALFFICRGVIFIFLPEYLGMKRALLFIAAGSFADFLPIVALVIILKKYKRRWLEFVLTIYIVSAIIYNVANAYFMYYTLQIINFDIILQASQAAVYYIKSLTIFDVLIFLFSVLILIMICVGVFKIIHAEKSFGGVEVYFILVCCMLAFSFYFYGDKKYFYRGYFRTEWIIRPYIINLGDIAHKNYTYLTSIQPKMPVLGKISDSDFEYMKNKGMFHDKIFSCHSKFKKIVMIAMESIDLDYLSSQNDAIPPIVTHNIDQVASSNISFANFYTSAQPTTRGMHALLTSRLDFEADTYHVPNLFSELAKHGYATYFLSAVTGYYGEWKKNIEFRYGPQHIFSSEYFEEKYGIKTQGWGIATPLLLNEAAELLQEKENIFIVVSTIDTHPPYGAKPQDINDSCYKNKIVENNRFLLSLCALDRAIADFLGKISSFLDENTLIILTSDHSATHGENYTKRKEFVPDRIPLIMISKNGLTGIAKNGDKVQNYASQIDLPVTLLDLLGIEVPQTFMGSNIFAKNIACTIHNRDTISLIDQSGRREYAIRTPSPVANWFSYFYGGRHEDQ